MSDNIRMNKIAEMISGNNNMSKDIMNAFKQVIQEKYISRIKSEVNSQYLDVHSNPCKNMRFLSVMKEFLPDDRHEQVNKMIDLCAMMNTYNNIRNNLNIPDAQNISIAAAKENPMRDDSIHRDGIYDIDSDCYVKSIEQKADVMSVLMMMIFLNNEK